MLDAPLPRFEVFMRQPTGETRSTCAGGAQAAMGHRAAASAPQPRIVAASLVDRSRLVRHLRCNFLLRVDHEENARAEQMCRHEKEPRRRAGQVEGECERCQRLQRHHCRLEDDRPRLHVDAPHVLAAERAPAGFGDAAGLPAAATPLPVVHPQAVLEAGIPARYEEGGQQRVREQQRQRVERGTRQRERRERQRAEPKHTRTVERRRHAGEDHVAHHQSDRTKQPHHARQTPQRVPQHDPSAVKVLVGQIGFLLRRL
mmetsp:Transcript_39007/g.102340  ORF Transcript_39007/g.102340 Transcript_39007/m.102340 type:complete len:258 (-) Transcript_39007:546-1319(-)